MSTITEFLANKLNSSNFFPDSMINSRDNRIKSQRFARCDKKEGRGIGKNEDGGAVMLHGDLTLPF